MACCLPRRTEGCKCPTVDFGTVWGNYPRPPGAANLKGSVRRLNGNAGKNTKPGLKNRGKGCASPPSLSFSPVISPVFPPASPGAVSYTHLDVYKRQFLKGFLHGGHIKEPGFQIQAQKRLRIPSLLDVVVKQVRFAILGNQFFSCSTTVTFLLLLSLIHI